MYGVTAEIRYEEGGCDFAGRTTLDNEGNIIEEEDYRYNEGIYILDNEVFWMNLDNDFDYHADENTSPDDLVSNYEYVTDEDKVEIKKLYIEYLEERNITIEKEENA